MSLKVLGLAALAVAVFFGISACKKSSQPTESSNAATDSSGEPEKIKVQHILIAFDGTLPGQKVDRSKEAAKKLADELVEKAKKPDTNFEALVSEFSSDRPPGVYELTNFGVAASGGAFPREQMVAAFGNVGFKLKVGEVGLAEFDEKTSPFGYHIIKRLNL